MNMSPNTSVIIKDSRIIDNSGTGGIFCTGTGGPPDPSIQIRNSIVNNNIGGGIISQYFFNLTINNSTISFNQGTGVSYSSFTGTGIPKWNIINSIITNNTGYGLKVAENHNVLYCDFWDNIPSDCENCSTFFETIVTTNNNNDSCDAYFNIFQNPQFVDTTNGYFQLNLNSPCIDAGINDSVSYLLDLAGNPRIFDGNYDGTPTVDMGAFEFDSSLIIITIKSLNKPKELIIHIYPNPTEGKTNISINNQFNECTIIVNDILGRVLHSSEHKNTNNIQLNLTQFRSGTYFVSIINGDQVIRKKIVKR